MGSPELPNDPGDEELRPNDAIHNDMPIPSDDSDSDAAMDDDAYDGYHPLPMSDGNGIQMENGEHVQGGSDDESDYADAITALDEAAVHADVNLPRVESADAEIERHVWSEPRPRELQIELDNTRTTQILNAMANIRLTNVAVPEWAAGVPEERWKEELLQRIRQRKELPSQKNTDAQPVESEKTN